MGQIAEDMLDGSCCCICGQYFAHPKKKADGTPLGIYVHDYPAVCWVCWGDLSGEEKEGNMKSDVETF